MTRFIGAVLGAAHAATNGAAGSLVDPFFNNGRVARILGDFWTGDAAQDDTISLGYVGWDTRFDAISTIEFDDMGVAITLDVGVASNAANVGVGAPAVLISAQDVATAAGTVSLLKSVTIANRRKPLWQLAGFASFQAAKDATIPDGGRAELIATLKGGNPGAGTIAWSIYGSPQ